MGLKRRKRELTKQQQLPQQSRRPQMMQLQRKRRWKKPRRKETMVKVDADVAEEGEEEDHVNRDVLADAVEEERIVEVLAINVLLQEEQSQKVANVMSTAP